MSIASLLQLTSVLNGDLSATRLLCRLSGSVISYKMKIRLIKPTFYFPPSVDMQRQSEHQQCWERAWNVSFHHVPTGWCRLSHIQHVVVDMVKNTQALLFLDIFILINDIVQT